MQHLSRAIAMALLPATAMAQLAINEALIDPFGPNAGNQIVEIVNTGNTPFDPTGWAFCVRPSYPTMPSMIIPAGGIVQVHFGQTGTNTTTDWFIPFITLATDGEIAIYSTTSIFNFGNPALLEDFVSWGNGAGFGRINEAIAAGEWPASNMHVTLPAEGSTIAWFGSGNDPAAWFGDSTPTLGALNQPAQLVPFGMGCSGSAGVPDLALNHLPWLGENYALDLGTLPPGNGLAIMITSFTETAPQNLATFGMPGCFGYLNPDLTGVLFTSNGGATFGFSLPASPSFVGLVFVNQALVIDTAAGNPLGATMTNPVRATTGQR
jgi:hypothetical protein